ncbi:MAG: PAS domain S-box protein [Deltaproteobacteria bacterium]|nr:PAS domain S-box protein [Deltaproteobacteria bacterium]
MAEKQRMEEGIAAAVFMIDNVDIITNCNKAAEDIFGWPLEYIKGKKFSDLVLPNDARKRHRDSLHKFDTGGQKGLSVKRIEQNVLHHDGYEFPVELIICPVNKRSVCSFIITARDISEKKQRLQVLDQASRNQQTVNSILRIALEDLSLDEILLHALEYVLLLNTPGLIDKGAVLLLDDDADYLVLRAHKGFDKKHVRACGRIPFGTCHCGRAALTGEIQFSECVDDRHDIRLNKMKPHGHYCVPICSGENMLGVLSLYLKEGHVQNNDEKNMLWAISNILAGVIERKKIGIQRSLLIKKQEAMITRIFNEKKLTEAIIQSLNSGLMVFDLDGKIVSLNPSGRLILSQFIDADASDPSNIAGFTDIPAVKLMCKTRKTPTGKTAEVNQWNQKGEKRTLQYTVVPWEDSSDLQIGTILQFKDITETLRIRQEMEKMNRISTVAEIASAVAHEVRNPLAGIKTMSQAIEENCDDNDENKEYITRIIKQVDRLNDLLTQFFTYAKPGKAKKEKVSMGDIVNETRQLLKVKLNSKRIVLEENYAAGLPDIYVDPDQMQQVFLNLMLNAIDAVSKDGKIEIKAQLADRKMKKKYTDFFPDLKKNIDYVAVYCKDNGQGMPPEVAAKAFEPFFTTKHHGSGLGLAIVYRILRENNAFIMADTLQKQGVTFMMMFESDSG